MGSDQLSRQVEDSDWLDHVVRYGLVVYGLVYLTVGWLMSQLVLSGHRGSVATKGVAKEVLDLPAGRVLLVLAAVGMAGLVVWRLLDLLFGHRKEDGRELWLYRLGDLIKIGIWGALAWKAATTAAHDSTGGGGGLSSADVLAWPGGQWLLGAAGLGILGYGLYYVRTGLSEAHADGLAREGRSGGSGTAYVLLGKVGYVAKGVTFALIGLLVGYAAVTERSGRVGGLDRAAREVLERPFGQWLLLLLALGMACYGLFNLVRARYLSR